MSAMTPLDRLRAAFPEKYGWACSITQAPDGHWYVAAMRGEVVIEFVRPIPDAAVDACIAARDALLRPAVERAVLETIKECERLVGTKHGYVIPVNGAVLTERVLRGEE